jgi:actin-like ATPase involved in cell morphogenesis
VLSRPDRLKFIKRFWQQRPEDRARNQWGTDGTRVILGRVYTCEEMVEAVIEEAVARAFGVLGADPADGFTANVVCPVGFDLKRRTALKNILCNRGAHEITLSNVIDEPLAAAILYGRIATRPPVNKDLLVFDAGAGTVDLALVRYKDVDGVRSVTVLAEQGRCSAGSDLDWALEDLIHQKIGSDTGVTDPNRIYAAYHHDPKAGRVIFEEECEQLKLDLSQTPSVRWSKENFLGRERVEFTVTQEEFLAVARPTVNEIDSVVQAVLNEARAFVQDFDGVDIALLVGGTSKVPFVRNCVERHCGGAVIEKPEGYLDELLATVRGVGFDKDFEDLILKRPPYTTELRLTFRNGSSQTVRIHQAFDKLYEFHQTFTEAVPFREVKRDFEAPISTAELKFISPAGRVVPANQDEFPKHCLEGVQRISVRLDIHANLRVAGRLVHMPYYAQVGLRPPRPFSPRDLNAPPVYPDDN